MHDAFKLEIEKSQKARDQFLIASKGQRNAEAKVAELQQKCDHYKQGHHIHIAKKGDQIVIALQDTLSQGPESQKVQFIYMRESEGVYKFRKRRERVKVERGNELFIRSGDEFISANKLID